jgi:hypothetical protein
MNGVHFASVRPQVMKCLEFLGYTLTEQQAIWCWAQHRHGRVESCPIVRRPDVDVIHESMTSPPPVEPETPAEFEPSLADRSWAAEHLSRVAVAPFVRVTRTRRSVVNNWTDADQMTHHGCV